MASLFNVVVGSTLPVIFGHGNSPELASVLSITPPLFAGQRPAVHVENETHSGFFLLNHDISRDGLWHEVESNKIYPVCDKVFTTMTTADMW